MKIFFSWVFLLLILTTNAKPTGSEKLAEKKPLTQPSLNLIKDTNHQQKIKKTLSRPTINIVEDNQQNTAQTYANYFKACYFHTSGKATEAFKSYQHVIEHNPSPYAYDGFFHLLFDVGQFKNIVSLYERKSKALESAFQNNLDFQLIVAQAYLNTDQETKAEKLFASLTEKYPDDEQVAYYTALSLIQNKQLDKALTFVDQCLKKPILHQKYFLFYFLKSKIYMQNNEPTQALATIEKSIELFPRFDRGWLFKAILLEQQGKINDAISGYKKFLDLVGSEQMIEKQLIQLLFSQKRFSEAAHYLEKMKTNKPEHHFDLALIEFKAENYDLALQHLDACLDQSPEFKQAKLLKVETLLALKKPHDALAFLQGWLTKNPQDNVVIHTILLLRKSGVSLSDLITSIETVNKQSPSSLSLLGALADLCIENGDYQKGIIYYNSIYNLTLDQEIKSKILYHVAYIYFTIKEYEKLDAFIPKALTFKPTTPDLYNLIAFYYVQTNQKIDQALGLIEKALETDQESPYYLDTKGLILLKLGNPGKAIAFLKKALEKAPNDSTVIEHIKLAEAQCAQ